MTDRRKSSPWGMIQAIAATVGLVVSLSVGVYTKVVSDVKSDVDTLVIAERLDRERMIVQAVEKLETDLLVKFDGVSDDMQGLDNAINDIETNIAIIQGQQIADAEVRKLVVQVNNTLIELKGDVKALKEKSVGVNDIAVQIGVLSSQVSTIQQKLETK